MSTEVLDAVAKWRAESFRNSDIPFELAIRSLRTEHPMIEAKRTGPREWLVCPLLHDRFLTEAVKSITQQLCKRNTNVPAVFSFAGVFADSDDYLTGNYVPEKEDIPVGVADDKV